MNTIIIADAFVDKQQRLRQQIQEGWQLGQQLCHDYENLTASALYFFSVHLAASYGWELASAHCGYRISGTHEPPAASRSNFTSEDRQLEMPSFQYIEESNKTILRHPYKDGESFQWIYRLHFYHPLEDIGASYEHVLSLL
jgi:hypothetical protein